MMQGVKRGEDITRRMEDLERRWFKAHRAAEAVRGNLAARAEPAGAQEDGASAQARLARAWRCKRHIMSLIELLEDDLTR